MTDEIVVEQEVTVERQSLSFADLSPRLQDAASAMKWTELMPVQKEAIPLLLAGQDVMVQSHTGSGKTGAFLLPALERIDPNLAVPQVLVLSPTRELAIQVSREAECLGARVGVRSLPVYGGVGYKAQMQGLADGAQIIIGTPGRILDHLLKGTLSLDHLRMLVFDEADRMLSMGFYPDMKQLQRYLPKGLQSVMFSATYPPHVKRLARQFLREPKFFSLCQEQISCTDVLHVVYKVPAMQKSRLLVKIIELENPASAIIFCNTKADVHFVSVVLQRFGYDVGEISADLSQSAREEVLEKLRSNRLKFLVATDVAARGIDIHELSHVFQYQPPQDHEAYVHRAGRTGRAGAVGVAISFVSGMEEIELEQIARKFQIHMEERQIPEDAFLGALVAQRAVSLLEAQLRDADNIQKERMRRFLSAIEELAREEDSQLLLAMLLDSFYQTTFHAPLEQPSEQFLEPATVEKTQEKTSPAQKSPSAASKRRRRRSRKKTPEEPTNAAEASASTASETRSDQPASSSVTPLLEAKDTQESSPESALTAPAKKRRRRRPRKSSKTEQLGKSPVSEASLTAGDGEAPKSHKAENAATPVQPAALKPTPRSAPQAKKPAKKSEGAKPRKKIFLE